MIEHAHLIEQIRPFLDRWGYAAVFALVFPEGFGIPTPGQTALIAGAWLAARGDLHIATLLAIAWVATVAGETLGYAIGRYGESRLLRRLGSRRAQVERVQRCFTRYGGWVVLVARFLDVLRQLNGIVAGLARMPWWRFATFNALGAAIWIGFWGYGAYSLGHHMNGVVALARRVEPYALAASCIALIAALTYLVWRSRHHAAATPGAGSPGAGAGGIEPPAADRSSKARSS